MERETHAVVSATETYGLDGTTTSDQVLRLETCAEFALR
jgi:hypothetical protein